MRQLIAKADTFFIASGYEGALNDPTSGMDASHRGGDPGFVKVESDKHLVFPDYAGNNHFNTIGNLMLDPSVGLLFVDFDSGSLLQLTGSARIDWDSHHLKQFPGARRLVVCDIDEVVELESSLPFRWSTPSQAVRTLRLIDKVCESVEVTSFVFAARDGGPLIDPEAGQHLPIEIRIPGLTRTVERTYSLSDGPGSNRYRISVKRERQGLVSRYLHDHLEVGGFIDARAPAGEFNLQKSARPVVLISAGVGATPMISMLHSLVDKPLSQPVWFVHGARDGNHHPFADEVRALVANQSLTNTYIAYSRPRTEDLLGVHYHSVGRLDTAQIERLVPNLDADFYLCGPTGFMSDLRAGLMRGGVVEAQLHTETFGPVA